MQGQVMVQSQLLVQGQLQVQRPLRAQSRRRVQSQLRVYGHLQAQGQPHMQGRLQVRSELQVESQLQANPWSPCSAEAPKVFGNELQNRWHKRCSVALTRRAQGLICPLCRREASRRLHTNTLQ